MGCCFCPEEGADLEKIRAIQEEDNSEVMKLWRYFLNYASDHALPSSSICVARRLHLRPQRDEDTTMVPGQEALQAIMDELNLFPGSEWSCSYANHENLVQRHVFQAIMAVHKTHPEREMHMFMYCKDSMDGHYTAICMYGHTEGRGECMDVTTFFGRDQNFLDTLESKLDRCETVVMVFPSGSLKQASSSSSSFYSRMKHSKHK